MSNKSWVIKTLLICFLFIAPIYSFNYFIDPLWFGGSSSEFNDVQLAFNERQQKANHIAFQPFEHDTVLLGSSRSTYINQHDFSGYDVYNFAVSNMSVQEYKSYVDLAKQERGKDMKAIIIGLDFFKSSVAQSKDKITLYSYMDTMKEPLYRYKKLLSFQVLEYSWGNFKASYKDGTLGLRDYDRNNVATVNKMDPDVAEKQTEGKIAKFKEEFYGDTYIYNENYKDILMEVKQANPNSEFIIYTTPISTELFKALVDSGRFPDYEKWLRDVVDVYGSVYNFMDINTVSNDLTNNYFDGHHFYPHVGTWIAHRISNVEDDTLPDDFGSYVTKENIDQYLEELKQQVKEL
ncbi:hypothetical protein [Fredinandcohnia quinoae]|uniref:Uncharacterized protein n=1 Tax=Fredinandcohnia quinoae TaxID=2918902 RepID=A0AAW5DWS2_9BACI|nr:hypothetical protein [Fredinandcohnia sp. SECRCQ15]MCH1625095.1 hypothetical protein [Fredinandcohnia sp. SECRCQ15]